MCLLYVFIVNKGDGVSCGFRVMVNLFLVLHDLPMNTVVDMVNFRFVALSSTIEGKLKHHPATTFN